MRLSMCEIGHTGVGCHAAKATNTHHVVTIDGQTSFELFESLEEAREMLKRLLSRMDGDEQHSLVLGALPPGERLDHSGAPGEHLHWSDHVVDVCEDEAFDAEEATGIFAYYLTHSGVPAKYSLRPRDLGRD